MAAALHDRGHLGDQAGLLVGAPAVELVPVRTLQDQRQRPPARRHRRRHGALRGQGDVAADQHGALRGVQPGHGRAEDVAGGIEGHAPVRQQGVGLAQGQGAQAVQQGLHLRRPVGRGLPLRLLADLRDAQGVLQHNGHQGEGGRRGHQRRGRKGAGRQGQGPDVVGVGMGDDDGVDPADLLQAPQVGQGIGRVQPHAGVEQHAAAAGLDHHATGADLGCAPEQVDAHTTASS